MKSCVYLAIGVGLCFLSYYNAFTFILLSVPLFLWTVFSVKKNRAKYRHFINKMTNMILIVLIIAGWFYIRNAYLYDGDFLGMRTSTAMAEMFAIDELRPSLRDTFQNQGRPIITVLTETDWIRHSFRSFIAGFGFMNIFPNRMVYILYSLLIATGLAGLLLGIRKMIINKNGKSKDFIFYLHCVLAVPITIGLSVYFSYSVQFQAQGRYLLPMLLPICIFIAAGFTKIEEAVSDKYKPLLPTLLPLSAGIIILLNLVSLFSIFESFYL